jgi:hypothetical protein
MRDVYSLNFDSWDFDSFVIGTPEYTCTILLLTATGLDFKFENSEGSSSSSEGTPHRDIRFQGCFLISKIP